MDAALLPSVIVPVLSEQSTFMLPKFSIAASRFTITFFCGHATRAVRKIDADDRRKKLRRQPDGEREREQERIENRFVQVNVESKDREHEHECHFGKQITESPNAALELCFRRAESQTFGDFAELRFRPVGTTQRFPAAAYYMRPHENGVRAARGSSGAEHRRSFLGWISFACERRFVNEEVARFEQPAVAWNNRAGG